MIMRKKIINLIYFFPWELEQQESPQQHKGISFYKIFTTREQNLLNYVDTKTI